MKKLKKNPANSDDKDRKREIDDFIATGRMKKIEGSGKSGISFYKKHKVIDFLTRETCEDCGSWTDSNNEWQHYDWCPKYKKSRRVRSNPQPIEIYYPGSDDSKIALFYKDKEIQFTGKDAVQVKDLMKREHSKFWNSKILQRQYPANRDKAGGFYLYMTEILKNEYPKIFK